MAVKTRTEWGGTEKYSSTTKMMKHEKGESPKKKMTEAKSYKAKQYESKKSLNDKMSYLKGNVKPGKK